MVWNKGRASTANHKEAGGINRTIDKVNAAVPLREVLDGGQEEEKQESWRSLMQGNILRGKIEANKISLSPSRIGSSQTEM